MNTEQSFELNRKLDELQQAINQIKAERYHTAEKNVPEPAQTAAVPSLYRTAEDAGCPTPKESEIAREVVLLSDAINSTQRKIEALTKQLEIVMTPDMTPIENDPKLKENQPCSLMATKLAGMRRIVVEIQYTIENIQRRLQV